MRCIKAVMKNREDMGQALMNHFAAHHIDQANPTEVQHAILAFLNDHATVKRLCNAASIITPSVSADVRRIEHRLNDMQQALKLLATQSSHSDVPKREQQNKHSPSPTSRNDIKNTTWDLL